MPNINSTSLYRPYIDAMASRPSPFISFAFDESPSSRRRH